MVHCSTCTVTCNAGALAGGSASSQKLCSHVPNVRWYTAVLVRSLAAQECWQLLSAASVGLVSKQSGALVSFDKENASTVSARVWHEVQSSMPQQYSALKQGCAITLSLEYLLHNTRDIRRDMCFAQPKDNARIRVRVAQGAPGSRVGSSVKHYAWLLHPAEQQPAYWVNDVACLPWWG